MASKPVTTIVCFDDHRSFTEDVRKRFSDKTQYRVEAFHSIQDMLSYFHHEKDNSHCKVAIIGVPDSKEQLPAVEEITMEIRKYDPETGLILLAGADKMEDVKKVIRFNIDAYIPRNSNMILRIHNVVKKKISEHGINKFRRKRNLALWVLLGFLIIAALFFIFARIRFPEFF